MDKYDRECLELTGMTQEQLLNWTLEFDCPDLKVKDIGEFSTLYNLDGTDIDYLVIDANNIKIGGVWHKESRYHPLYFCECCGRGPLTRDGN